MGMGMNRGGVDGSDTCPDHGAARMGGINNFGGGAWPIDPARLRQRLRQPDLFQQRVAQREPDERWSTTSKHQRNRIGNGYTGRSGVLWRLWAWLWLRRLWRLRPWAGVPGGYGLGYGG